MFINPKIAINNGWIKGIKDLKQIQPNAIDFTLDKVMILNTDVVAAVGETHKTMRPLYPYSLDSSYPLDPVETFWALEGLRVYDGMSDMYVEVPEGVAAVLYTRSTFARNGVFIISGLYDSGFKGNIGFTIYTIGGPIQIERGTRIGQIAFVKSDDSGLLYTGGWNHPEGTHYAEYRATIPPPPGGPQAQGAREQDSPLPKSDQVKALESTHKWNSDQTSKPAGTKSFI